jgi:hypothetical protein
MAYDRDQKPERRYMIANWLEGTLILTPENERDQQALSALAEACTRLPEEPKLSKEVLRGERPIAESGATEF